MPQLKLILDTSAKYYYFKDQVLKHYYESTPESFIYLLPVNRAVRYFKQQLFSEVKQKGIIDPPVFTFNSLIQRLFKEIYPSTKIIGNTIRILFLDHILRSHQTDLGISANNVDISRSLIRKIDNVLSELKEFGYDPANLNPDQTAKIEKVKEFDLILQKMHAAFSTDQFSLIDEPGLINQTISDLDSETFFKLFPNVTSIYINGYGIYTPPMLEFVNKAKSWCNVQVMLEYHQSNTDLFQNTLNAFDALKNLADEIDTKFQPSNSLQKYLFRFEPNPIQKMDINDNLIIQEAQNREQEICLIAAKIKKLHGEKGIPLHQIGITFPNIEIYFSTLKSVFAEYEIPVNISTGNSLLNSYLIKAYLQILKIVISGFSIEEIFKLLLSPFYQSEIPFDYKSLKKITVLLRLTHLRGNWQEQILKLSRKKNYSFTYAVDKEAIQSCLKVFNNLVENLSSLTKSLSVQEFYDTFLAILKKLGLFAGEYTKSEVLNIKESEKEFRAFNKFVQLLEQLKWTIQILYGDKKFRVNEFYNFLFLICEDATFNLREWPNYGVQVMPRLEIQAAEPKYLFIGGLIEGDFPRKFSRDIFFNDSDREILGLNASEDLLSQDRFLFYQLISGSAEQIILSYPKFHNESVNVKSSFLSNLQDICSIEIKLPPSAENYFSKNKIIEYIGKHIHSGFQDNHKLYFEQWANCEFTVQRNLLLKDLNILLQKRKRNSISIYEGLLSHNKKILKIIDNFYQNKAFSITALESFAFCPMQYFMQRILKLEEELEIESTLPALERGTLIHTILFKFFMQLKIQKQQTQSWNHLDLLKTIAEEEFNQTDYEGLLWELEKEIYFGNRVQPGLWSKFLEVEKQDSDQIGFKPLFFETKFGSFKNNQQSDYLNIPYTITAGKRQINLTGKIDRIDVDENGLAIIYDYKTGKSGTEISFKDIYSGLSLQLPVYLAAANNTFKELKFKMEAIAGAYYQVQDSENCKRFTIFGDVQKKSDLKVKKNGKLPNAAFAEDNKNFGINELIDCTSDFIRDYTKQIFEGNFRHTRFPQNLKCSSYCAFKMICRKDIGKLQAMDER